MNDFNINNKNHLIKYNGEGGDVIIPDGVIAIGAKAFKNCTNLRSVIIPNSVTHIGASAFSFSDAQSIIIGEGVTTIADLAFHCCTNLQSITIPENVKSIGENVFRFCTHLQNLTICAKEVKIGNGAFHECNQLQDITINGVIQSIGNQAFPKDLTLRKCTLIPDSEDAEQCKMVLSICDTKTWALPFLSGNIRTNATLRKNLQRRVTNKKFRQEFIADLIRKGDLEAFKTLLSLTSKMEFEEIRGYIDLSVENNAVEMTNILIEYQNRLYPSEKIENMREIEFEKEMGMREKTLADYKKIFSIKKGNGVYIITKYKDENPTVVVPGQIKEIPVSIAPGTFASNNHIQTVYLEEGVTSISPSAFEYCDSLQSIEIPGSVTKIEELAFSNCKQLQSIVIPESVKSIGYLAFFGCKNLKSVTIGSNVKSIGGNVFDFCKNLTISAPSGSYAQTYAKENNIPFKSI